MFRMIVISLVYAVVVTAAVFGGRAQTARMSNERLQPTVHIIPRGPDTEVRLRGKSIEFFGRVASDEVERRVGEAVDEGHGVRVRVDHDVTTFEIGDWSFSVDAKAGTLTHDGQTVDIGNPRAETIGFPKTGSVSVRPMYSREREPAK